MEEELKQVVWTDNSFFSTAGFSNRPWVTRILEEEWYPNCIDEIWPSGMKCIMVRDIFCEVIRSELYILSFGSTMNLTKYRDNVRMQYIIPF